MSGVTIKSTRIPDRVESRLNEDDIVEMGMSHELKIDGDGTWVSYKVATKVRVGETADDATKRALEQVTSSMRMAVDAAVRNVKEMSE